MSRLAVRVTAIALVAGLVLDLLVGYSPFVGYPALIGLGGCVAIILISKWVGTTFLERPEDYYPQDTTPEVQEDLRG